MWCLKRCGKRQAHRFLVRSHDIQVQHWKFAVYSCDEPLQVLKKHPGVYAADTIIVLKHKYYPIVLLCSGIVDVVDVIDHRWKGMRVCEDVCYGCAKCTSADKAKRQVGWRVKNALAPSSAYVGKLVPPTFSVAFSAF